MYNLARTGVFIDASNLRMTAQENGLPFPRYGHLVDSLFSGAQPVLVMVYLPETKSTRRLIRFLKKRGFLIRTKKSNEYGKCNFDVEIALDMVLRSNGLDHLILFSGDGDFIPVMRLLRSINKTTGVVSYGQSLSKQLARDSDQLHLIRPDGVSVRKINNKHQI